MMKTYLCLLIVLNMSLNSLNAQENEIDTIAKLFVVADYFEFFPENNNHSDISMLNCSRLNVDGIKGVSFIKIQYRDLEKMKFYFQKNHLKKKNGNYFEFSSKMYESYFVDLFELDSINSIAFYEEKIGKQKFENNEIPFQCDFVIAYVHVENRFFKLKGFKVNEFMEFFNRYLLFNNRFLSGSVSQKVNDCKKRKYSKKLLSLIKVEELDLVEMHSSFVRKQKLRDKDSCYLRDWLIYNY